MSRPRAATWPTLETPADATAAWVGLLPVRDQLDRIEKAWDKVGVFEPGPLADQHRLGGPYPLLVLVTRIIGYPGLPPEVEPMTGDPLVAFWRNRNGLDVLRERRKAGQPTRGQITSLSEHVNAVLFPQVVQTWTALGVRFTTSVPTWHRWQSTEAPSQ